jgi:hypothetical protein
MKNLQLFDILIIVLSAIILSAIYNFGTPELLAKFSFIIVLIGYYSGKAVRNYELKTKYKF